jgi:hypothetical protein
MLARGGGKVGLGWPSGPGRSPAWGWWGGEGRAGGEPSPLLMRWNHKAPKLYSQMLS